MGTTVATTPDRVTPSRFRHVGANLYRYEPSGNYYALVKRGDKQFRRSLRTTDRKLAERRLSELRQQVGNLSTDEDRTVGFAALAERWLETAQHALKPSTVDRRRRCIKALAPFFRNLTVRNITRRHCEQWLTERGAGIAPQTFAHELDTMRAVFNYAMSIGLILSDPSKDIKRRKIVSKLIEVPSREDFRRLVAAIRESDGRISSQARAKEGADLVELLAYSGCRLDEARNLRWQDVSFEHRRITITGGQRGTKNHEIRTVPMTDALARLLERIHKELAPQPADLVIRIRSARKCIETACRRLGFATYSHHDFRHFFATTCIEAGVDIPTVSRWLGHKDGGALAMRVYGHLRQEHSFSQIRLVDFVSPLQRPDSQSPAKETTGDHAMLPGAPVSV